MAPLFSLDEGATLNMELMVDIGKGYQPAHSRRKWVLSARGETRRAAGNRGPFVLTADRS
jgi:DNA-directed RNA polymerase alpha subunit